MTNREARRSAAIALRVGRWGPWRKDRPMERPAKEGWLSEVDTVFGGIRAILEITRSTSLTPNCFLRLEGGNNICEAPTSSITSMALSGNLRSLM